MRQRWMQLPRTCWPVMLGVLVGCGSDYVPAPIPPAEPPAPAQAASEPAAPAPTPTPTPTPAAPAPATVTQKAEAGVGAQGHYGRGFVTTPVATYFWAQQATVFKMQIPETLKLYKAEHEKGPQSHEEFMALLKANQIQLPELPEGHRYEYDPQAEQLNVVRPAQ